MAVQLAKALGAEVTVFTSSKSKREAARALGADHVVLEDDEKALEALESRFDLILSTVPEKHDLNPFIPLLKRNRTLVVVGALEPMKPVDNMQIAFFRRGVAGSLIGSIAETQEVLDLCARQGIAAEIELIPIQQINRAFRQVEKGDVRFRYVIDMRSLQEDADAA